MPEHHPSEDRSEQNRQDLVAEISTLRQRVAELEALPSDRASLRLLIEHAPDAVYVTDLRGYFLDGNRAAEELIGYDREELIGKSFLTLNLLPPQEIQKAAGVLAKHARGESNGPDEFALTRKDGTEVPVEIISFPVEANGEVLVLGFVRDVTERKLLEEELHNSRKLRSLGTLAAGVAHEFNNLLTGIIGYTQLMRQKFAESQLFAEEISGIQNMSDRAARLTRQMLAFGRMQTLRPTTLDLNECLNKAGGLIRLTLSEDIALDLVLAPDLGNVRADSAAVQQILLELAMNAQGAMLDGGRLIIETANLTVGPEGDPLHRGVDPGVYVTLTVTDTGWGMERETREKAFDPFFTTKDVGVGTGLGLSMVHGVVRQQGGRVTVRSEPGMGTTVHLFFPRTEGECEEPIPEFPLTVAGGGSEVILVVDDEMAVLGVVQKTLERYGYTVLSAAHPDLAEEMFKRHEVEIELLLADVVMPAMSGDRLYRRLAALKPSLKVLYMSGYASDPSGRGSVDEDAPFLAKPFSPHDLICKVREVLGE